MTTTSPTEAPHVPASGDEEPLAVRETLPIAKRSRGATRLTIALLVCFAISAGFLAGVLVQKDHGSSSSSASASGLAALAQQFGGSFPGAGAGSLPGAGAGSLPGAGGAATGTSGATTTGQVKLVDGTNVYVVDAQGKTTKVATTSTSKISTAQPSSLSALKAGDTVTVVGTTGTDGTVTATSITSDGAQASSATP
jgi:hypothetical protein